MKEYYEIKFWKEWLEADHLKRLELVKKLALKREITNLSKLPENLKDEIIANFINGYFEDLESAVYTKIRLESKKKMK